MTEAHDIITDLLSLGLWIDGVPDRLGDRSLAGVYGAAEAACTTGWLEFIDVSPFPGADVFELRLTARGRHNLDDQQGSPHLDG